MAIAALVWSASLLSAPPAHADNYVGATGNTTNCSTGIGAEGDDLNNTDPNPLTFSDVDLTPNMAEAVWWSRTARFDPTRHDTSYVSSVSSNTDIVSYDQDYTTYCFLAWHSIGTGGVIGLATCVSLVGGGACEKHETRFDLSYMNAVDQNNRRTVACHETAHAVGLAHRYENGCTYPTAPHAGELTLHDVTHINGGPWIIFGGTRINPGGAMKSYDARYTAVMQTDGNFVVYGPSTTNCPGTVCWASNTFWTGSYVDFQTDGNMVIYRPLSGGGRAAVCSSRTNGYGGSTFELQTDSNLVVYAPGHIPVWATESGGTCA